MVFCVCVIMRVGLVGYFAFCTVFLVCLIFEFPPLVCLIFFFVCVCVSSLPSSPLLSFLFSSSALTHFLQLKHYLPFLFFSLVSLPIFLIFLPSILPHFLSVFLPLLLPRFFLCLLPFCLSSLCLSLPPVWLSFCFPSVVPTVLLF